MEKLIELRSATAGYTKGNAVFCGDGFYLVAHRPYADNAPIRRGKENRHNRIANDFAC